MKEVNHRWCKSMFSLSSFDVSAKKPPEAKKVDGRGQARNLKPADLELICSSFKDEKWVVVFGLAYLTGSRISEICSMEVDQIKEHDILIKISKLKDGRVEYRRMDRDDQINDFLSMYEIPETGYVFPGRKPGTHIGRKAADEALRAACEVAEIDGVSTHSFRRSLATNLIKDAGWTIQQVQRYLGHKNINNTLKYFG